MKKRPLLEISVESLDAAVAAERGGADRIELCEDLRADGVTPGAELMRAARKQLQIPIFAMIRPRGGDFFYSQAEFERLIVDLATAKACGMDGAVFGLLLSDRRVNVLRTRTLVELARPLPVTFHRAFDETPDVQQALEDVIASGATRILTSGGKPTAWQGIAEIAKLLHAARNRIGILPGGGINAANLASVAQGTQAEEFHSGLSTALPYPRADHAEFEAEVRKLAQMLRKHDSAPVTVSKQE